MGLKAEFRCITTPEYQVALNQITDESILYRNGNYLFQMFDGGAIIFDAFSGEVVDVVRSVSDWLIDSDLSQYFVPTTLALELFIKSL